MTDETIVAVYDTAANAQAAATELKRAGVPDRCISLHSEAGWATRPADAAAVAPRPKGRPAGFWTNLFGGEPDHDTSVYERSVANGATVLTVGSCEADLVEVLRILEDHDPVDVDERARRDGLTAPGSGIVDSTATAVTDSRQTLQLAEESLTVGKRVVNRGGTRIRRFVVETPVEHSVTLRDERVALERHAVTGNQPVKGVDFTDRTVELTAMGEEAVVSKFARVYEEVGLRKAATERVETIHDTVRKQEFEVEQAPGSTANFDANNRPK